MAETSECEPIASSSDNRILSETKDDVGPTPEKRRKLSDKDSNDKLEHRLGGILCCAVCLDLPRAAVYQCTNGHLMCAPCFTHLLADARLRDEAATCPNCRIEISKTSASRNLAVEKAVSELPLECKFCSDVFPRHSLQHHEEIRCEERLTGCRYACIGCGWRGPAHEATAHETSCTHPHKSAAELLDVLAARERNARQEQAVHAHLLDLLSYEKITFNDLQLKSYRTDEFVHKLYYETSRFAAFNHQWVVKAFVNKNQRDPTQSYEREITYQLILKSKPAVPLSVQYVALRGPYGEADVGPRVYSHTFSAGAVVGAGPGQGVGVGAGPGPGPGLEDAPEAPAHLLPLADCDTNRLLSNKAIHFRLIMFLATK